MLIYLLTCLCSLQAWAGENLIRIDSVQVFPAQQAQIGIEVINTDVFTSFQIDIPLPTGFAYITGSAALNPQRKGNHSLSASVIGGHTLRLLCFSMTNEPFSGNAGEVVSFTLSTPTTATDHSLAVVNYLLGNASGQNIATGKIDGAIRTMGPLVVAIVADADTVCLGETITLTAQLSGGSWYPVFSWSSTPAGLVGNQAVVTYVPATAFSCEVQVNDGYQNSSGGLSLEVAEPPIAFAGEAIHSCFGNGIQLNGEVQHAIHSLWQGGHGLFEDTYSLQTTYFPNELDLQSGTFALSLTAFGFSGCAAASDEVMVSLYPTPLVSAGNDIHSCFGNEVLLQGEVFFADEVLWQGGSGTFAEPGSATTTYLPSEADLQAGTIQLWLTAYGSPWCETATDTLVLALYHPPTAIAGADMAVCFGDHVVLLGEVQYATSVQWQGGNGSFENSQNLQTVYYPVEADLLADSVALVLTAYGSGYCEASSDTLWLFLTRPAVVFAGQSLVLPYGGSHHTMDATASYYESLLWTSSGDGTFENPLELHTVYHPGPLDEEYGEVSLTLTAFGSEPCGSVADSMVLIVLAADDNVMFMPAQTASLFDTLLLQLEVSNRIEFNGFGAGLSLPISMQWLTETASLTNRAADHELSLQQIGNRLVIRAVSPSNQAFAGETGSVFEVAILTGNLAGIFPLNIENASLFDSTGTDILTATYNGIIHITLVNNKERFMPESMMKASISPIPLSCQSYLNLNLSEAANVQLSAVGLDGRIRFTKSLGMFEKGRHSVGLFETHSDQYPVPGIILLHFKTTTGKSIIHTIKYF